MKEPSQVEVIIQALANDLDKLIKNIENLHVQDDYENVNLFLNKSLRYINSALSNERSNEHFASYKLLKSAANNLENFLNDEQSNILDFVTSSFLRGLINNLKINSENIEKINFLDLENTIKIKKSLLNSPQESTNKSFNEASNIANDWILSDFNLNSTDFNSQLSLISGNLFDLNFTYQICKVLNTNCLLMKERSDKTDNPKNYILKVII